MFSIICQMLYYIFGLETALKIQGSINKFPVCFHMVTFIDSTHMKLKSPSK